MAKNRSRERSFVWKLVLFGLAAIGAYIVLGWAFKLFSFVFSVGFWLIVLAVAIAVIYLNRRMDR